MNFESDYGQITFDGDSFDFYIKSEMHCDIVACFKVINGQVTEIDSNETFEDIVYNYFSEVGWEHFPGQVECYYNYEKHFKIFEQHIINNHKPTGKFTKPARH